MQNYLIDMWIKVTILDLPRDDDFALFVRRCFLFFRGTASAEQEQGKDKSK